MAGGHTVAEFFLDLHEGLVVSPGNGQRGRWTDGVAYIKDVVGC